MKTQLTKRMEKALIIDALGKSKHPALDKLGVNGIADLAERLTDKQGSFSEDNAKDLCMDAFDGVDEDDEDPEADWGDQMYARQAGK